MAGEFKQQCPSCEAMVSIKDESLIGKKTECTKCKFRFLVEAPSKGKPADDKKAPPVKSKASGKEAAAKAKQEINRVSVFLFTERMTLVLFLLPLLLLSRMGLNISRWR